MKHYDVVHALIENDKGEVFCCQRGPDRVHEGMGEFPSDKVKEETHKEVLVREIKEESNSDIEVLEDLGKLYYEYIDMYPHEDFSVTVYRYRCKLISGNLEFRKHIDSKWINFFKTDKNEFIPSDGPFFYIVNILKCNKNIITLKDWKEYCPPKKESQWKEGRSAEEFGRYFTKSLPFIPKELYSIVHNHTTCKNLILFPEFETKYEKRYGLGEGRNHDGLLVADDCVFGIEAKVDESFDKMMNEKDITTPNRRKRYMHSYEDIIGDGEMDPNIYYQLISGSLGTILEAKERKVKKAVFVVVTFLKEGSYEDEKVQRNQDALNYFINKITVNGQTITPLSTKEGIDFFVEKICVRL